jgi:hypothetical protein
MRCQSTEFAAAAAAAAQDDGDTIDPALRVVAYSMEEGNWELVAWMINHHASAELGPYFLPAIAQVRAALHRTGVAVTRCCLRLAW